MKILVLTAMKDELTPIIKDYKVKDYKSKFYNEIKVNKKGKNKIYFTYTGIGKVNAAASTTALIHLIKPDLVVNFGTAGGIDVKVNILDIVIADNLAYHDVDVTAFGYEYGQVPQSEKYLKQTISQKFLDELEENEKQAHIGTILSGDQFINDKNKQMEITSSFDNVYAVEMESTAIVDVCNRYNKKVLVIRGISDLAHNDSTMEFDQYLEQVVIKFKKIIDILMNYEKI